MVSADEVGDKNLGKGETMDGIYNSIGHYKENDIAIAITIGEM